MTETETETEHTTRERRRLDSHGPEREAMAP